MQTNTFERWITTFYILIAFYVVGVRGGVKSQLKNKNEIIREEDKDKRDLNQELDKFGSIFSNYRNTFVILLILGIFSGFRGGKRGNQALISIVLSVLGLMLLVAVFQYMILDIEKFFNGLIVTIGIILALVFGLARSNKSRRLDDYAVDKVFLSEIKIVRSKCICIV